MTRLLKLLEYYWDFPLNPIFPSKEEIGITGTVKLPEIWIIRCSWSSSKSTGLGTRACWGGGGNCHPYLALTRGPSPVSSALWQGGSSLAAEKISCDKLLGSALLARMCYWVLTYYYYCPIIPHSALRLATSKLSQWQVRKGKIMSTHSLYRQPH